MAKRLHDLATEPVEDVPQIDGCGSPEMTTARAYTSCPSALIGVFCLKFALSGKAIAALIELLRLKLDVSGINNVDQVLSSMTCACPSGKCLQELQQRG